MTVRTARMDEQRKRIDRRVLEAAANRAEEALVSVLPTNEWNHPHHGIPVNERRCIPCRVREAILRPTVGP